MLDVARGQGLSLADWPGCFTHQDAVHDHVSAGRQVLGRELVFGRHVRKQGIAFAREFDLFALIEVGERDQDVVPGIELQDLVSHLFYCRTGYLPARCGGFNFQNRCAFPPRTASRTCSVCRPR